MAKKKEEQIVEQHHPGFYNFPLTEDDEENDDANKALRLLFDRWVVFSKVSQCF